MPLTARTQSGKGSNGWPRTCPRFGSERSGRKVRETWFCLESQSNTNLRVFIQHHSGKGKVSHHPSRCDEHQWA